MPQAPPRPDPRPVATRERVNDTFVSRFEQWALPRMAGALPPWVTPDTLTLVALAGSAVTAFAYAQAGDAAGWLWLASAGFVVHWWGDSLDGTLARVRDIRRERYGFYVDQMADVLAVLMIFAGLGAGGMLRPTLALAMALAYLLMFNFVNMVAVARGVYRLSFLGGGPTELRLLLIAVNTVAWALAPRTFAFLGGTWTPFEVFALVAVPGLFLLFLVSAWREWRLLARLDPPPPPRR